MLDRAELGFGDQNLHHQPIEVTRAMFVSFFLIGYVLVCGVTSGRGLPLLSRKERLVSNLVFNAHSAATVISGQKRKTDTPRLSVACGMVMQGAGSKHRFVGLAVEDKAHFSVMALSSTLHFLPPPAPQCFFHYECIFDVCACVHAHLSLCG